ncbi:hypothetical protein [Nocardia asiatica]|uniref:hypothetical protein n=1 Tax=Nocardia asiatica TaxID=209252 RepID=UPI002453C6DE|nr:hypothetical protein [Nocardia asiatica]
MADKAVRVLGLVVDSLREWFDPAQDVPPLGGGTTDVWVLAGETVVPPPWLVGGDDDEPSCDGCGPYLWVRLARRWRTGGSSQGRTAVFPDEAASAGCGSKRAITIEAGIARCHPMDGSLEQLWEEAQIQWDDGWRIEAALCAAMRQAEEVQAASATAIGAGEAWGPEGMVTAWLTTASAQL